MLLFYFLKTISEDELARLEQIQLKGQEERFLKYCLSVRNNRIFSYQTALVKLGCSKTYLYKTTSVILGKVLTHLYGPSFNVQITQLSRKVNLVAVMRHLMKIQERQLLKQGDSHELFEFYNMCFTIECGHYASDYDAKLLVYYQKQLITYAPAKKVKYLNIETQILKARGDMNRDGAMGLLETEKVFAEYEKQFIQLAQQATAIKQYGLIVMAYTILAVTCLNGNRPQQALEALNKANDVIQKHPDVVSTEQQTETQINYCKVLYISGRYAEAYEAYGQTGIPDLLPRKGVSGADVAKYLQVALVTGNYPKAKYLLDKFFIKFVHGGNSAQAMAQLHYLKYWVYTGAYSKAIELAAPLVKFLKVIKVFQYDVECRILYAIALYFNGNKSEAYDLCERSLKILYAKNDLDAVRDFVEAFQFIKAQCKNGELNKRTTTILHKFQSGTYLQYGALFNRMVKI
jgi:tetratricopeptide (TPR) repeat protein